MIGLGCPQSQRQHLGVEVDQFSETLSCEGHAAV